MKLMTKAIENALKKSPLYSKDGQGMEAKVIAKFFDPCGAGTWLITEGEKQDNGDWLFFGYATLGYEWEWGYVTLSELQSVKGRFGLGVEREIYTFPNEYTVKELAA